MKSKTLQIVELLQSGEYTAVELGQRLGMDGKDIQIRYFSVLKNHYKEKFVVVKEPGKRTRYHITDQSQYKSKPRYRSENMEPIYEPIIDITRTEYIPFPSMRMTKAELKAWADSTEEYCNDFSCKQLFDKFMKQGGELIDYKRTRLSSLQFDCNFLHMKEPALNWGTSYRPVGIGGML